ncbi:MAG: AbrB/MazE/SpoVT family DNA-binding domain-containing protein [Gemmataceae bacterium]|nr:AbrB/MazE/SpoVT family DNA-binding domain-containing protein [Gemmataceae bacterium]
MKATIDGDGRIQLGQDLQSQLGVRPGDDVIFEKRGGEWVLKAAKSESGLGYEGNVLVHRGTSTPVIDLFLAKLAEQVGTCTPAMDMLAQVRDERLAQLTEGVRQ